MAEKESTETERLQKRLADAQARIAQAKTKSARIRDARALPEQVKQAEQAALDESAIADAEEKLGPRDQKFRAVETDEGVIILKPANPLSFKKYQDVGKNTTTTMYQLVIPCIHYPSTDEVDRIFEVLPYTLTRCADAVCYLAGIRTEELAPK